MTTRDGIDEMIRPSIKKLYCQARKSADGSEESLGGTIWRNQVISLLVSFFQGFVHEIKARQDNHVRHVRKSGRDN